MQKPIDKSLYELRILLVDDDDFMRTIIVQGLRNLGFNYLNLASDGRQAIELLNQKTYDLLLSDIQMPYINGIELMKRIRMGETAAARDLRMIAITSFSNTEVLGSALAVDINGFLVKPVMQNTMLDKITLAMNESFKLQLEQVYQKTNTDLNSIKPETERRTETETKPKADVPITEKYQYTSIHVRELELNMRLHGDVLTKDGRLLITTDQELSEAIINRLIELESLIPHQHVWIKSHS